MTQPKLTLTPSHSHLLAAGPASAWVQVCVTAADAPAGEASERKPLDVKIALDCSGSMGEPSALGSSSTKMEQAKLAVQYVLGQLSSTDRASIVVYGSSVQTLVELTSDHQASIRALDRVQPNMGLTALAPALMSALDKLATDSGDDRQRHVFLVSDGQANMGETNPDVIASSVTLFAQKGIRVSTFGLGSDYNELLMEAIAVAGQGGYHYLASADDAPAAFAAELEGLTRTMLHSATLTLEAPAGGEIVRMLGTDVAVGELIPLGDLPAGSERVILCEVLVRPGKGKIKSRGLLSAKLTGSAGLDGAQAVDASSAVRAKLTSDEAAVSSGVNTAVLARVAELEAAQAQREAAAAADRGNMLQAGQLLGSARLNVEASMAFADEDSAVLLTAKLGDLGANIASLADYDTTSAKEMRFSSYRSRTSR
jgi:Ca-activated chloride channel family protein